jgi:hypothetical protein
VAATVARGEANSSSLKLFDFFLLSNGLVAFSLKGDSFFFIFSLLLFVLGFIMVNKKAICLSLTATGQTGVRVKVRISVRVGLGTVVVRHLSFQSIESTSICLNGQLCNPNPNPNLIG